MLDELKTIKLEFGQLRVVQAEPTVKRVENVAIATSDINSKNSDEKGRINLRRPPSIHSMPEHNL